MFIAFIGLRNAGIIVASPATLVTMGNLRNPDTLLAMFGLLLIAALLRLEVKRRDFDGRDGDHGCWAPRLGLVHWQPQAYSLAGHHGHRGSNLDIRGALRIGLLEIVFVFLFVDLFDNVGTLVAVGKKAGLFDTTATIPRMNRILLRDAAATIVGSLAGTSTVVSYIESAAGVVAGGRSGVTSIVVGLLFFLSLWVAPVVGAVPAAATAPALIVVGSLLLSQAAEIPWEDPVVAIPAFLTIMTIPLTFSIANGLAFGFTSFTVLKVVRGQGRELHWMVYLLDCPVCRTVLLHGRGVSAAGLAGELL